MKQEHWRQAEAVRDVRMCWRCRSRRGLRLRSARRRSASRPRSRGQGRYTEVYEVLTGLPVRIATGRRIQLDRSRATFVVTQYDVAGKELIKGKIEAGVAG